MRKESKLSIKIRSQVLTAIVAALAFALAAQAAPRVDKPRYDRCELADGEREGSVLLVSAEGRAGVCRERVKCWSAVNAAPRTFDTLCAAGADRTCPEALSCVWDSLELRAVSARVPPAVGSGENLLKAAVVAFDGPVVTVRARGHTFRVARAQLGDVRHLDEGQTVLLHLSDEAMLDTGVWRRPAGHVDGMGRRDLNLEVDRLALITEGDHGRSNVIKVIE